MEQNTDKFYNRRLRGTPSVKFRNRVSLGVAVYALVAGCGLFFLPGWAKFMNRVETSDTFQTVNNYFLVRRTFLSNASIINPSVQTLLDVRQETEEILKERKLESDKASE